MTIRIKRPAAQAQKITVLFAALKVTLLGMHAVSTRSRNCLPLTLLLLQSVLLVACDVVQLCGEYVCVAYQDDCDGLHSNRECQSQPRQCEAPGSIRDRAPDIINQLREAQRSCTAGMVEANAAVVSWDATLASVSVAHTRDMAENQFESFVGSDGLSTKQRLSAAGIEAMLVFENISVGPQTVAETINYWLDINTDCQQMVNTQTTRMGMACTVSTSSESGPYWSLLLAGPEP